MPADDKRGSQLVALGDARERAIQQLSDAFAHDVIDVDDFERRLTLAHRASTVADLEAILGDLVGSGTEVLPAQVPMTHLDSVRPSDRVIALFGGVERRGVWTAPRHLNVSAIMGGIVLDFREALLPPGVTDVHVSAVMGGVQIIVPPNLAVEVSGVAVMGGFGHVERTPSVPDPTRPLLRVRGVALMGGVSVETRLAGESEHEAHRRRRHERKLLRRGHEAKLLPGRTGR